jgi:hypothetical protein
MRYAACSVRRALRFNRRLYPLHCIRNASSAHESRPPAPPAGICWFYQSGELKPERSASNKDLGLREAGPCFFGRAALLGLWLWPVACSKSPSQKEKKRHKRMCSYTACTTHCRDGAPRRRGATRKTSSTAQPRGPGLIRFTITTHYRSTTTHYHALPRITTHYHALSPTTHPLPRPLPQHYHPLTRCYHGDVDADHGFAFDGVGRPAH